MSQWLSYKEKVCLHTVASQISLWAELHSLARTSLCKPFTPPLLGFLGLIAAVCLLLAVMPLWRLTWAKKYPLLPRGYTVVQQYLQCQAWEDLYTPLFRQPLRKYNLDDINYTLFWKGLYHKVLMWANTSEGLSQSNKYKRLTACDNFCWKSFGLTTGFLNVF